MYSQLATFNPCCAVSFYKKHVNHTGCVPEKKMFGSLMIQTNIGFGTKWLQPSAKTHDSPVNWEVNMENFVHDCNMFFQHLPQPEAAKCNMNITDKLVPSLKMNTSSHYAVSSLEKTDSCWYLCIPSLKNALQKNTSGYFR